ncbi:MAG: thioredoxin [Oscillospiraceae bacterium]|nr:thioredoxin [Oscillospiraceae bacterium]MDY4192570.1 thioredoxin [Oscillospiraceae bacterium]
MAAVHFNSESFTSQVLNGKGPAMVDFWASWCGPCRMLGPVVEELSDALAGKVLVGKLNVDEEGDIAQKFGVMSIPTVIFFKDGAEKERIVGYVPKEKLLDAANRLL